MSLSSTDTVPEHPLRVLHVDDDPMLLETVAAFLEHETERVEVVTETDPTAVPARLTEEPVNCVVSDYEMPGTDGLGLLQTIREDHPQLPFILYTGKGSEEIAGQALNAGATGYLQKGGPEQHRRLGNRIEHAVEKYRAEVEAERYSRVLRALDYPLYVVDDEPRFQYVNEAFAELTGYDREEVIGSKPALVKTEAGVERSTEALRTVLSEDGPDTEQFEIEILPKEGDPVPCRDHLAADVRDGEFSASVGILRNRREEERRRQELLLQNERLEEFVSIVSHDLRTPLQIATTAGALARESGDSEHFDRLEAAHDRMERMIDELLTLAREGKSAEEPLPVALADTARTAWGDITGDDRHTVTIETERTVEAEPDRLRRLFENLLCNAVEHGAAESQSEADDAGDADSVAVVVGDCVDGFYVADDGPGMPSEVREQAFESGFTTAPAGTGFGLTIVGRIAEAHGWDVTVTDSEWGGTRFEFTGVDARPADGTEGTTSVVPSD